MSGFGPNLGPGDEMVERSKEWERERERDEAHRDYEIGGHDEHDTHDPGAIDEMVASSIDDPALIAGEEGSASDVAVNVTAMRQFSSIVQDHWIPLLREAHTTLGTVSLATGAFPHANSLTGRGNSLVSTNQTFLAAATDTMALVGTAVHDMSVLYENTENDNLVEVEDLLQRMSRAQAQADTLGAGSGTDADDSGDTDGEDADTGDEDDGGDDSTDGG